MNISQAFRRLLVEYFLTSMRALKKSVSFWLGVWTMCEPFETKWSTTAGSAESRSPVMTSGNLRSSNAFCLTNLCHSFVPPSTVTRRRAVARKKKKKVYRCPLLDRYRNAQENENNNQTRLTSVPQTAHQLGRVVDDRVQHDHGRAVQGHVVQGRPPVAGHVVAGHGQPSSHCPRRTWERSNTDERPKPKPERRAQQTSARIRLAALANLAYGDRAERPCSDGRRRSCDGREPDCGEGERTHRIFIRRRVADSPRSGSWGGDRHRRPSSPIGIRSDE